jgi:hypothetical protein
VELELVHVRAAKLGKEYLYELGDGADELSAHPAFGLTDVEALRAALVRSPAWITTQPRVRRVDRGVEATP